ncbi:MULTISPECIES: CsbD family protein [Streptomyces]|uniref:CsbD family protein n=1 Tax=Streptomyces morookaense TaxID=1970 RepID=A0A7Y7B011_STRMO|nr:MULTISPECIES: CsbD family protein [Streptomyces]MCC2274473.1 CsbD family protein [Streptomyces sp. ET3-23]NVK76452.1 CsbD family protein [Streptomyces morookaense]GHF07197.1 hypothetical protein GCM10010359_05350 [Streptomyces morookaense]
MSRGRAKAKQAKGAVKETIGQVTDNPEREVEGFAEKLEGKAKAQAQEARKAREAASAERRKHAE